MVIYDAVIVGAGPAGLNCAQILAESNKKVLLLEQKTEKDIGQKVCAGGLTEKDVQYLKQLNFPEELLEHGYNSIYLNTPRTRTKIKSDKKFLYTVDRKELGQWQLKRLKQTDAEIRTNSRVTEIGKQFVKINGNEKINLKHLVGADGSSSFVRHNLIKKGIMEYNIKKIGMAIQYIIPTRKYKDMEYFFDSKLFESWYAWIFPHKDYVSIGTGCVPSYLPTSTLRTNFESWLNNKNINVSKGKYEGYPINFDYQGYKFGNVYLAGDAAGLASGLTGEGIYQALISGEEIAKMIINKNYKSNQINEILKFQNKHHRVLHFFHNSGPFRGLVYESIALLAKNHFAASKLGKLIK